MTTVSTPRIADAVTAAEKSIDELVVEVTETVGREAAAARAAAEEYALHLENGGDPTERPPSEITGTQFIYAMPYLNVVYRAWNEERGSRNPFSPITSMVAWVLVEHALEQGVVGTPVLYADLHKRSKTALRSSLRAGWDSDQIAKTLAALQGDDLVLRRTKVGGKVAYLLRERREGEVPVGRSWDPNDPTRVVLWASDVPEERWQG